MKQDSEKYYLLFESWSLDANQWSIVMDGTAVLLAVFGVLLGFYFYRKQRSDSSKDAFDYFQSSLPELIQSIEEATIDLQKFNQSLDLDIIVNPILSASLNDKFLSKINLIHLNRFYYNHRKNKFSNFRQLLVDSNFFGTYHNYISKELNYFRTNFQKEQNIFSKWRLLRSAQFFATDSTEDDNKGYKEFYTNWIKHFNENVANLKANNQKEPSGINRRNSNLITEIKQLEENILPYINIYQRANETSALAHKVIAAYKNMVEMKANIKIVLQKDIAKFETVLKNMKTLLEQNEEK